MEEVIYCTCRNHTWVIGSGGTRCSRCGYYLQNGEVKANVCAINKRIKSENKPAVQPAGGVLPMGEGMPEGETAEKFFPSAELDQEFHCKPLNRDESSDQETAQRYREARERLADLDRAAAEGGSIPCQEC